MIAQSESSSNGVRRQRSSDRNAEPKRNDTAHHPNQGPIDEIDDENDEYLVSCRCESAKAVSTLLSCLRNVAVSASGSGSHSRGGPNHNQTSLITSTQNASTYSVRSSRRNHNSTSTSASSSLQPVTVYCSATNMTFHIASASKLIQASVDMPSNMFSDYSVATTTITTDSNEQDDALGSNENGRVGGEFCINLVTLLECLHCLGTQNLDTTKLCFSYNMTQEVFKLELLEELSGILSTASIPGMLSPDFDCIDEGGGEDENTDGPRLYSLAHAFRQSDKYVRIIIQSESLHELITELDYIVGGTMANVTFDNHELRIGVIGYLGECHVVLPTRGTHVISIDAPDTTANGSGNSNGVLQPTWTYPLHAFMESMRGLEIADETCITINMAGMMAIQHQVIQQDQTTDVTPSFVDFILCCMVDEEEENDDYRSTIENDGPILVQQDNDATTSLPTKRTTTNRARIVSQTKQIYDNSNNSTSDSDDDDEENTASSKSHITPTGTNGARLFGTLAMEEEDDDDDESPNVRVQTAMSSSNNHKVTAGRHLRRRPRTVETSSPVQPAQDSKKSRSIHQNKASDVATTIRAKTRGNNETKAKKQSRFNDTDSNEESANSDDDMEVALALSGLASTVSTLRTTRRPNRNRRTRRTIHDDEDEDDGSSSPELVYGQQH